MMDVKQDGPVVALAWRSDSRLLAIASAKTIRIVDVEAAWSSDRFNFDGRVAAVVWNENDLLAAIEINNEMYRVTHVRSGADEVKGISDGRAVALSKNGRFVAVTSEKMIAITDFAKSDETHKIEHGDLIDAFRWSPDARFLAIGFFLGSVEIKDVSTGNTVSRFQYDNSIAALAWSPDGRFVAIAVGRSVHVVEAATGVEIIRNGHDSQVTDVAWNPDGLLLASGAEDGKLRISEVLYGRRFEELSGDAWARTGVQYDEQWLSREMSMTRFYRVEIEPGRFTALGWSLDGKSIASARDKTIRTIDALSGKKLNTIRVNYSVDAIGWGVDGGLRVASVDNNSVRITDPETGKVYFEHPLTGKAKAVAWNSDKLLLTIGESGKVQVIELGGKSKSTDIDVDGTIDALGWSQDGQFLAICVLLESRKEAEVRVVDRKSGQQINSFRSNAECRAIAWSADNAVLAIASRKDIQLFEIANGKRIVSFEHRFDVDAVAWSPNGGPVGSALLTGANSLHLLRAYSSAQALVNASKDVATHCLTQKLRASYFLSPAPPTWCVERRLWPYQADEWQAWLAKQKAWLASGRLGGAPRLPKAE